MYGQGEKLGKDDNCMEEMKEMEPSLVAAGFQIRCNLSKPGFLERIKLWCPEAPTVCS